MSAPQSSVNGPDAASWPFSFKLARYCRCTGRSAAIFSLSWMYSMTAANFMAASGGADRFGGARRLPRPPKPMPTKQPRPEEQVAQHRADSEPQARDEAMHQPGGIARVEFGQFEPCLEIRDQEELRTAQERCGTDAHRRIRIRQRPPDQHVQHEAAVNERP